MLVQKTTLSSSIEQRKMPSLFVPYCLELSVQAWAVGVTLVETAAVDGDVHKLQDFLQAFFMKLTNSPDVQ